MTQVFVTSTAERHARRMAKQKEKRPLVNHGFGEMRQDIKVPRGTARNLRRQPLQYAYAKRLELAAAKDSSIQ